MNDFIFHNPTKIIFGRGREAAIGKELHAAGVKKVLLVYGQGSVKRHGLFDRVVASLAGSGIAYAEYGGVSSNPVLSHARQGVALAKAQEVDAILTVGGGSVIDEGKAIAVGAVSDHDLWEYYAGRQVTAALPVFTILTLAATGSEMNGNSVITNQETQQKFNIGTAFVYPRVSILNPELTCTVPLDYTAYGAVDAIAHVIEAYFTKQPGGPRLQDRLVEGIIKTIIETTDKIMEQPAAYEARAEFMWAATLALNGLTPAGVGEYNFPNHMIEHALSAIYNIAHGAGLSIVMPAWMKWYLPRNPEQFERFAEKIFGVRGGAAGIEALERWFSKIHAPIRLNDAGIPADDIDRIAVNAHDLARRWGIAEIYSRERIAEILGLAL